MESLFEYERIIIFSESSLMMVVMLKKIIKINRYVKNNQELAQGLSR